MNTTTENTAENTVDVTTGDTAQHVNGEVTQANDTGEGHAGEPGAGDTAQTGAGEQLPEPVPAKPLTRAERRAQAAAKKAAEKAASKAANASTGEGVTGDAPTGDNATDAPQGAPGSPVILPAHAVLGENLSNVLGYNMTRWPKPDSDLPYAPYHVGVSIIDNSIVAVNDIPSGVKTFIDAIPGDLAPGEQAYCLLHYRDTVTAVRALGYTSANTMIEATGAFYLLCGYLLNTTAWQCGPGRMYDAKGESKVNAYNPSSKFAMKCVGVSYGNTSRLRIELAHHKINGGVTGVDLARAAFAGDKRPMPLVLATGLGESNAQLFLPSKSTPHKFKWHPSNTSLAEHVKALLTPVTDQQ